MAGLLRVRPALPCPPRRQPFSPTKFSRRSTALKTLSRSCLSSWPMVALVDQPFELPNFRLNFPLPDPRSSAKSAVQLLMRRFDRGLRGWARIKTQTADRRHCRPASGWLKTGPEIFATIRVVRTFAVSHLQQSGNPKSQEPKSCWLIHRHNPLFGPKTKKANKPSRIFFAGPSLILFVLVFLRGPWWPWWTNHLNFRTSD